jgi:hypothetical protein
MKKHLFQKLKYQQGVIITKLINVNFKKITFYKFKKLLNYFKSVVYFNSFIYFKLYKFSVFLIIILSFLYKNYF